MTSRKSVGPLQLTRAPRLPRIGATTVRRSTAPVATFTAAIMTMACGFGFPAVHAAGTACSQDTYTVPPAGTGFDACEQPFAADTGWVCQCTPSVESVSMITLGTTGPNFVQVM